VGGAIDELVKRNLDHRADSESARAARPGLRVAVLTCMDARIRPGVAMGLELGEAHVIRNAGGLVTEDALRSLAISQGALGTREVMVVMHTRCGLEGDEHELRKELARAAGLAPPFPLGRFASLERALREGVQRIRTTPWLPHRDQVRGFVYDVDEGRLREVEI
jgi:carbonic anhydrase